jgi:Pyruvate/2-oxoacid:ferredoxin oxidoreductase gamma subunit
MTNQTFHLTIAFCFSRKKKRATYVYIYLFIEKYFPSIFIKKLNYFMIFDSIYKNIFQDYTMKNNLKITY